MRCRILFVFIITTAIMALFRIARSGDDRGPAAWKAVVTFQDGKQETLYGLEFGPSWKTNQFGDYIEAIPVESPRKRFWVHPSQVKSLDFLIVNEKLQVTVTLDDGSSLQGILPDPERGLKGNTGFGNVKYDLRTLKNIRVLGIMYTFEELKDVRPRDTFAKKWRNGRRPSATWTIVDGESSIKAPGFGLLDCYTNVHTRKYSGPDSRAARAHEYLYVRQADQDTDLPLERLIAIEITGRLLDGGPEIILTNLENATKSMTWRPWIDDRGQAGKLDEDDMLIWQTSTGYEGISVLPLRRIQIKRNAAN